jgi:hypothetical protein
MSERRRSVVRNSFARHSIMAEVVRVTISTCDWCGGRRERRRGGQVTGHWLYRFHVDDDQGKRQSGPIAGGRLFCSRECCETYVGQPFDETKG